MPAQYKMNPNYVYSQTSPDLIKIISLKDDDNKIFTIKGISAGVFLKILNGDSLDSIQTELKSVENAPPEAEISDFLKKFLDDLQRLNFIEEK